MNIIVQPGRHRSTIWLTALIGLILFGGASSSMAQNKLEPTGNVGVGTTTPNYPLEVSPGSAPSALPGINILPSSHVTSERASIGFGVNAGVTQGWILGQDLGGSGTRDLYLYDVTNNRTAMYWGADGKVGIGSTAPSASLQIKAQNVPYRGQLSLEASDYAQITFYSGPTTQTNLKGHIFFQMADNQFVVNNFTGGPLIFNPSGGYVGIGTTNPTQALDVHGNINVTGNINAKYQDVAEWVEAAHAMPAGTVVVLNPSKSNQVMASSQPYDTRVAGVISAQPGIALGEGGEGKVLVATTGRVKVKVDATRAAIHVGDLLVTSDKEGVAMKSEPLSLGGAQIHRPGTLIGKALEPLESGMGEILVLLSLQ